MNRRGFLGAMLAAGMAPAIVRVESLMPMRKLIVPDQRLILWGDGIHDDTAALQALIFGKAVCYSDGASASNVLRRQYFKISDTITLPNESNFSITGSFFDANGLPEGRPAILAEHGFGGNFSNNVLQFGAPHGRTA